MGKPVVLLSVGLAAVAAVLVPTASAQGVSSRILVAPSSGADKGPKRGVADRYGAAYFSFSRSRRTCEDRAARNRDRQRSNIHRAARGEAAGIVVTLFAGRSPTRLRCVRVPNRRLRDMLVHAKSDHSGPGSTQVKVNKLRRGKGTTPALRMAVTPRRNGPNAVRICVNAQIAIVQVAVGNNNTLSIENNKIAIIQGNERVTLRAEAQDRNGDGRQDGSSILISNGSTASGNVTGGDVVVPCSRSAGGGRTGDDDDDEDDDDDDDD